MNITFRQLRAFLAVANLGGFTRAADRIGLSQSATSITVRELEDELGVRLLDRTTRQVRLTDAGAMLAATGTRLMSELDACLHEIHDIGAQRKGRVLVACVPSVASSLMPAWLLAAQQRLPNVQVVLYDDAATEVIRRVQLGEIEIGIAGGVEPAPGLHYCALRSDPMHLVCPRDHPLARKRVVRWSDLAGQKVVMLGSTSGSHEMIRQHLEKQKIAVEIVLELAQPNSVLSMVDAGMGLSIMPSLAASSKQHPDLVAKPLGPPELRRAIIAMRREDRSLSPAAQALWDLIQALAIEPD